MDIGTLLDRLFPAGHAVEIDGDFVHGTAEVEGRTVLVVGTTNEAAIGVELALAMATEVLDAVRGGADWPIVLLVDTQGQRLRHRDELLGIHAYMAHLAQCLELARLRGHRIVSLVYGRAVSGGYITGGMMADACFALASAEISVMNLPAMARVTKIPQERLEELAKMSPVFAPGAENYWKMGQLAGVWEHDLAHALTEALAAPHHRDVRRQLGAERAGRIDALAIAARVRCDPSA
jgi:malonate decarboxylase gamma subunit